MKASAVTPGNSPIVSAGTISGGRWIAWSGLVYVAAWLLGLIIGFSSAAPSPTDSPQTNGDAGR
jgi:hypothetical protein